MLKTRFRSIVRTLPQTTLRATLLTVGAVGAVGPGGAVAFAGPTPHPAGPSSADPGFADPGAAGGLGAGSRFIVSPSANVSATDDRPFVDDGSLVAVGGAAGVHPQMFPEHWLAAAGFVPGDIDGFGRLPAAVPGSAGSFAFSLLSNEGGFLDGDVLLLSPGGGVEAHVTEAELALALGLPDAALDVDAVDFDGDGRLLFSLQNDLGGSVLGDVFDGDVLRLEADGTVSQVLSESEVQAKFEMATGLTASIGDVLGVEWVNGQVWVTLQSPSSHDGAVLSCAASPTIVAEEDALGLGGAELDALSVASAGEELAALTVSAIAASPGETLHFECYGPPGGIYLAVKSGGAGYWPFPLAGWGSFYVDPLDPWLSAALADIVDDVIVLDGSGFFEIDYTIPAAALFGPGLGGVDGWTLQMLSADLEISAPLRIEKL